MELGGYAMIWRFALELNGVALLLAVLLRARLRRLL